MEWVFVLFLMIWYYPVGFRVLFRKDQFAACEGELK
jgi:hypothetical protein